ncbi:MAG TPA: hypothetical protein VFB49_04345 [Patescibacteria group bacterium]|nr:hypothetical protein [Patescibacteria group bacterium]
MILKILGVVLLVAGVLVLVYHGFSVPKQHEAKLGPLEVKVNESQRVDIPNWAGVAGIAVGGACLLLVSRRK